MFALGVSTILMRAHFDFVWPKSSRNSRNKAKSKYIHKSLRRSVNVSFDEWNNALLLLTSLRKCARRHRNDEFGEIEWNENYPFECRQKSCLLASGSFGFGWPTEIKTTNIKMSNLNVRLLNKNTHNGYRCAGILIAISISSRLWNGEITWLYSPHMSFTDIKRTARSESTNSSHHRAHTSEWDGKCLPPLSAHSFVWH